MVNVIHVYVGLITSYWIKSLLFNNLTISYLVGVHSSGDFLVYFTLYWVFFLHRLRIRMLLTLAAWQTLMASYAGLNRVVSPWSERSRSITLRLVYLLTKTTMYMFWWVLYSFMVWEFSVKTCTCITIERYYLSNNVIKYQMYDLFCLQELTEEGLPFLILFHHPDDKEITQRFSTVVQQQLMSEKCKLMFSQQLWKFWHPV